MRFRGRDVNIHCNNPADKADVMGTVWVVQRYNSEGQLFAIFATRDLADEHARRLAGVFGSGDSIEVDEWSILDRVPDDPRERGMA